MINVRDMAAHELIRLNEIDDNDEESGKSNETNGSGDESQNSVEEEPPSKDELIAVIDRLKNVTLNFVICFELLNSPLLVIEANVSKSDCCPILHETCPPPFLHFLLNLT